MGETPTPPIRLRSDHGSGIHLPRSVERIERRILVLRGRQALLDADLAEFHGVETLDKAVRRNLDPFPADFMFLLTREEADPSRFPDADRG
ncbi:MAG: ORF6N domain-containing protein [Planctomycetota bacterium]